MVFPSPRRALRGSLLSPLSPEFANGIDLTPIRQFRWRLGVPGTIVFMLARVYTFEVHYQALCLAKGPVPLAGSFDKKRRAGYDAGQFEEAGSQKGVPTLSIQGE